MEALDAAAVEAALSLCEEAVSEGHTLPGPWETQDLKPSEPPVQHAASAQENQDASAAPAPSSGGPETQSQPDIKKEEQFKGSGEGTEAAGSDVNSSLASDDGAAGSEVAEEAVAGAKEAAEATVKTEGEDWSQPEPNPPCLGGEHVWMFMLRHKAHVCLSLNCFLKNLFSPLQTQKTAPCLGKSAK